MVEIEVDALAVADERLPPHLRLRHGQSGIDEDETQLALLNAFRARVGEQDQLASLPHPAQPGVPMHLRDQFGLSASRAP